MKVAAAHFDDRAEAAVEGAAARGLDDVDLPSEQRVARQDAGGAIGQAQRIRGEPHHGAVGVVDEAVARTPRQAGDVIGRAAVLERAEQLAKRLFPFAAHQKRHVPAPIRRRPEPGSDRSRRRRCGSRDADCG